MTWRLPIYEDLTPNQRKVIDLEFDKSHLVTGPPGSGKSVMAVYRVQALGNLDQSVKFLMFNQMLKLWTQGALNVLDIPKSDVSTYHAWFPKWFRETYGETPPSLPGNRWDYDFPQCLEIAIRSADPLEQMGKHLIIDEGQDLPPELWIFLQSITAKTFITVFADEYQIIKATNSTLKDITSNTGITHAISLETNFRNTRNIAKFAGHFYTGDGSPPVAQTDSSEDGDPVVLENQRNTQSVIERISIYERNNSTQSIGVLLPTIKLVESYFAALKSETKNPPNKYHYKMKRNEPGKIDFSKPGIKLLTHQSAKGLEFDTVFLPELQKWNTADLALEKFRKQMYVLVSRARRQLFLSYTGSGDPAILGELPIEDLDDQR